MIEHTKILIEKYYPKDIYNLNSKAYLELEDKISRNCVDLAMNISNIIYNNAE